MKNLFCCEKWNEKQSSKYYSKSTKARLSTGEPALVSGMAGSQKYHILSVNITPFGWLNVFYSEEQQLLVWLNSYYEDRYYIFILNSRQHVHFHNNLWRLFAGVVFWMKQTPDPAHGLYRGWRWDEICEMEEENGIILIIMLYTMIKDL